MFFSSKNNHRFEWTLEGLGLHPVVVTQQEEKRQNKLEI